MQSLSVFWDVPPPPPVTLDVVRSLYIRQNLNFNQNTYIQANENLLQILKHFVCEFPRMSTNSRTDFSYKIGGFLRGWKINLVKGALGHLSMVKNNLKYFLTNSEMFFCLLLLSPRPPKIHKKQLGLQIGHIFDTASVF